MSAMVACLLGSNACFDGTVNSLMHRRPQNARVNAALNMHLSHRLRWQLEDCSKCSNVCKTFSVISCLRLCMAACVVGMDSLCSF